MQFSDERQNRRGAFGHIPQEHESRQSTAANPLPQQAQVSSQTNQATKASLLSMPAKAHIKFPESKLAHKYLDGLKGLEIGGSAHNSFGLKTRNVDYCADLTTVFKRKEVELCGEALKVDVVAAGDELPLPDESEDFVLSSHVIEHFFDPIKAIKEWLRVVRPGGYVFIIAPHKERTFDKDRARTPLQELLDRHSGKIPKPDVDTHKHYSVWITEDLLELCRHFNWNVVEFQDVDDKVGNGFTLVIQKAANSAKPASGAETSGLQTVAPTSVSAAPSRTGEHPLLILGESINPPGAEVDGLLEPSWYHDFSPLGLKTPQRGGIFPANQKCKQAVLFPLIDKAVRLARKRGGKLRGIELFCADGYYGMYAMRQGMESMRGIDLNEAELSRARAAAKILGWNNKMAFEAEDACRLSGDYDFCICAGGLYHLSDPGRLLSDLARKVHGPLVIQTVVSLANTSPNYFESPAPGWTWGSRFSYGYLQNLMAKTGWKIIDCSEGTLPGNERPDDRGSAYLLCVPPSYVQSGVAKKHFNNLDGKPNPPKDGLLYDQPNKYARPLGLELGPETLVHGYQEFRLTANTIEPLSQDPPLARKQQLLSPIFTSDFLTGKTLLDIGANGGFFTFWARQKGAKRVVALDMDETYVQAIRTVQAHFKTSDIHAVSCRVQDWEEPADVVLAFAMIHWLFSCTATYGSLDAVISKLRSLTRNLLVVEWVAPDDAAIAAFKHTEWNPSAVHGSYNLLAFEAALRQHFARTEIIGSTSGTRVVYLAWCQSCETTVDSEPPLMASTGRVISNQCLAEFQGKKYFSRVYASEDGQSILKQATDDLAWRDAQFLHRLNGPHFPRVLEARQENGWSVAVFERIVGRELTEIIPEIAATPQALATFFSECLDIIEALQGAGITHRDIQLQNIMVRDGQPVLIDFGWAIAADAPYFSPGDLGANGRPPDDSFCDVYSMGKVFSICCPVNHHLFSPLISAMTAADSAQRITEVPVLRKILNDLPLAPAWGQTPVFQTDTRKFKIGFLTADPKVTACAYLRLTAPLEHLHARKEIEHLAVCDLVNGHIKIDQPLLRQSQIIVVQRGLAALIPYHVLRQAVPNPAVKIVFELDDALTLLPPSHQAFRHFQMVRPHLEAYLKNADLVTVTTPKLKELYSHFNKNIEVLPNTVDANLWLPVEAKTKPDEKTTILFSGTVTHEHDLALVEKAIERIIREFPERVEFLFWGNAPATLKNLRQVRAVSGFMPNYPDYARRLKSLPVDLALVPLELTPFNRAKSTIKWLEYSACKIPGIYTRIEAYTQVVEHGKTGWLVPNTTEAWYDAMKQLIQDDDLRRTIAENAHQAVVARHLLKPNTHLWMKAYQRALALPPQKNLPQSAQAAIVIPTFNNLALTHQCIDSILSNTPQGLYEIIAVDNGSTDGTPAYLKQQEAAGRLRAILRSQNHGYANGCNQGALVTDCPYLVFLNNDTVVQSGWLEALLAVVARPQTGVAGAKLLYPDGRIQHAGIEFINGVPDHPHRHAHPLASEVNTSRELDMVTGACLITPRNLFLELGGFDEVYRNGVEDIDYCLRVRSLGRKVVYEPQSVVFHHEGRSAGRFNHVNENLKIFFGRWANTFDQKTRFVVPARPKTIPAGQSLLLATNSPSAAQTIVVSWQGSFLDHGSLSHVNRELAGQLKNIPGLKLHCGNQGKSAPAAAKFWPELARQISMPLPAAAAVTVRHAWPPNWQRPATGKLAVIQPWEFGSLPQEWVNRARDVDEFWVPSAYVRDVYVASGVPAQKVVVVPNGVNTEKFHPLAAPLKLATRKKFRFLFVGGTIGRKGPDLLLEAYLKNFTPADDVCLVIKDFGGKDVYQGQTFEKQIRAIQANKNAPEILYLNEELPPDSLPGLYAACNCLVLPYRGEGFGLPVLEAMACGLPVMVTAGGATDDFVRDEFAWRIPAAPKACGREVSGMKLAGEGWLLEPSLAALGETMRHAFANQDEARERGQLASRHARQNWSWKKSALIIAQRLQELAAGQNLPAPVPARPAAVKAPPVAQAGRLDEARKLFGQKKLEAAWSTTVKAIARRPFHPEAFLLLAEIAAAAGNADKARQCAKHACDLAPGWNPPKQFLNKPLEGEARPAWLQTGSPLNPLGKPRLSVCLIVKNEEKFLAQSLKSIRDLAQQIIVVDTGSTDRTMEIAGKFGAEIHSFPWGDDFAAARNAALEQATGDWILMLDADEELPNGQHAKLREDMKDSGVLAYRLPLVNRGQEAEGRSFVPRLFRNAPGAYYFGRIHEQVFPSLLPLCRSWGMKTAMGTAEILHHGYNPEMLRDRNKIERNLKLLRLANEENPRDVNLTMNFGLELARSGDPAGGVAKYREAFHLMSELPPDEIAPELSEVLLTQFTSQLYKIRGHEEVVQVLNSPLAKKNGLTASLHLALGLSQFELKNYPEAAEQIRQCLAKRKQPALSPINTDILTAMPHHCLALALAQAGDATGAEKAFEAALVETGNLEGVKLDYAKFLAATNRPVESLHKMHELVAANPRNHIAWRTGGEIALSRPEFLEFARDWTGEAMRYVADDPVVVAQRGETLMLSGDTVAAGEIWERIWNADRQPKSLAALILCEITGAQSNHAPDEGPAELAASRAFIAWYQRLIAMRSQAVVDRLNEQMDKLSRTLPTAARMIEKALMETRARAPLPA